MNDTNQEIEQRIMVAIDKIRPYLISDGGNIEFIKYEDNIVYVRLLGACANCGLMDMTLKNGVEDFLINEIPQIKQVINIDNQDQ